MKITVPVKLNIDDQQKKVLLRTMEEINEVCNGMSEICFQEKIFRTYDIHYLFYHQIRGCYSLSSQMAIRAIAKVADSYKKDQKVRRTFRKHGAVAYDSRLLTWKEGFVSLTTLEGRMNFSFSCGEYFQEILKNQKGETDLIFREGNFYLSTTCEISETPEKEVSQYLGIDLGIVNLATDSLGHRYSGLKTIAVRKKNQKLRKKLQAKGTKSSKRLLKKRRKKEQRFAKNINHCISKKIVDTAQRHSMGIALEDLKGIRQRVTVRKGHRYGLHSWSFYDLGQKILYKAKRAGVRVVFVDPRYTSQECRSCGHIEKRNRKTQSHFECKSCGHTDHADLNASGVIARRAAVNRPHGEDLLML